MKEREEARETERVRRLRIERQREGAKREGGWRDREGEGGFSLSESRDSVREQREGD